MPAKESSISPRQFSYYASRDTLNVTVRGDLAGYHRASRYYTAAAELGPRQHGHADSKPAAITDLHRLADDSRKTTAGTWPQCVCTGVDSNVRTNCYIVPYDQGCVKIDSYMVANATSPPER